MWNDAVSPPALSRIHPPIDATDVPTGDLCHRIGTPDLFDDGTGRFKMHDSQLALIASFSQAAICDIRDSVSCASRNNQGMRNERDLIRDWLAARLQRLVRNPIYARAEIAAWCRNQVPTRAQALAGLRHTFDIPGEGPPLVDALFDLMIADGEASEEELSLMRVMVASVRRREGKA